MCWNLNYVYSLEMMNVMCCVEHCIYSQMCNL